MDLSLRSWQRGITDAARREVVGISVEVVKA